MTARFGSGERPVVQTTCDFTIGETWRDQYWDLNNEGVFNIRRTYQQLCVAARGFGESAAVATTSGGYPDAQWIALYTRGTPDVSQFQNVNSGLCRAARGLGESRVVQTACDLNQPGFPKPKWNDSTGRSSDLAPSRSHTWQMQELREDPRSAHGCRIGRKAGRGGANSHRLPARL
jgi:hypothetical protein